MTVTKSKSLPQAEINYKKKFGKKFTHLVQCVLTSWTVALVATIAALPCCNASISGLDSISCPCAGLPFLICIAAQSKFVSNRCIIFTTRFPNVTQSFRSFSVILICDNNSSISVCSFAITTSSSTLCRKVDVLRKPTGTLVVSQVVMVNNKKKYYYTNKKVRRVAIAKKINQN